MTLPRPAEEPDETPADTDVNDDPDPMYDIDAWEALHDRDKVSYISSTLGEIFTFLDNRLNEIDKVQIEVEDPQGYVRFTIGTDGRLLNLFIHESARTDLTNLQLEQKFTDMLAAADQERAAAREEILKNPIQWGPPPRRAQ